MEKSDSTLRPVSKKECGEGLPYAPVDCPNEGDIWSWKVGSRVSATGFHRDRYLIGPKRLQTQSGEKLNFRSKKTINEYLARDHPGVDVDKFWDSFYWNIPADTDECEEKGEEGETLLDVAARKIKELKRKAAEKNEGGRSSWLGEEKKVGTSREDPVVVDHDDEEEEDVEMSSLPVCGVTINAPTYRTGEKYKIRTKVLMEAIEKAILSVESSKKQQLGDIVQMLKLKLEKFRGQSFQPLRLFRLNMIPAIEID